MQKLSQLLYETTSPIDLPTYWDTTIANDPDLYANQGKNSRAIDLEQLQNYPNLRNARINLKQIWKENADVEQLKQNLDFVHWIGYVKGQFTGVFGFEQILFKYIFSGKRNDAPFTYPVSTKGYVKSMFNNGLSIVDPNTSNKIGFLLGENELDFASNEDVWSEMFHPNIKMKHKTPSPSVRGNDVVWGLENIPDNGMVFECLNSDWKLKAVTLSNIKNPNMISICINICELYEVPYIYNNSLIDTFTKNKYKICEELLATANNYNQHFYCTYPKTLQLIANKAVWFTQNEKIALFRFIGDQNAKH